MKANKNKIKILATADIHKDKTLLKKLSEKADKENVDLVVIAGDLTFFEQDINYIVGYLKRDNRDILIIPGNHESVATIDFLAQRYNAINLHGKYFYKNGIGFFGAGLDPKIGPFQTTENELFNNLYEGYKKLANSKLKIMVTHSFPANTKIETLLQSTKAGSEAVKKAIETFKPKLLICGHLHEASGFYEKINNTILLNVSRTSKIIEVDKENLENIIIRD